MTDRVLQDLNSFDVSCGGRGVEVYVFGVGFAAGNQGDVMITVEDMAYPCDQRASFVLTPEEATLLKEFLTEKGY